MDAKKALKQIKLLQRRYISKFNNFYKLDNKARLKLIKKSRLLLLQMQGIIKSLVKSGALKKEFFKTFDDLAKKFSKQVGIKYETNKFPKRLQNLQDKFYKSFVTGTTDVNKSMLQKDEFWNKAKVSIEEQDITAFTPRSTLLDTQIGSKRRKAIEKLIRKDINRSSNKAVTEKRVQRYLEKHYPTGKIPFNKRQTVTKKNAKGKEYKEKVLTQFHLDIDYYSELWVKDLTSIVHSEAMVTYTRVSGLYIVEIRGGHTDNPVCDPFSTPPDNVYSTSVKNKKYPLLTEYPPYHVNCSKYMVISSKNF